MPSAALPLASVDAAILVGGLGTRLRGVIDDVPKPLAPVLGRPFLFYQLDMLALRGARSVTLCCGYKADLVRATVGSSWLGMPVYFSVESSPLGTGGALRHASPSLTSSRVLVLNGDSWLAPDWNALCEAPEGGEACLALVQVQDSGRFGAVELDGKTVTAFKEKNADGKPGLINGGIYLISQGILSGLPEGTHSLEREVFPSLVAEGRLRGVVTTSAFLDIGIPSSYAAAGEFCEGLGIAPHSMFPERSALNAAEIKLGVCAVIFDEAGRVLLERRSDCGWWCLPGGSLDPGETLAQGAVREAKEETGLDIEIAGFLGVFSDPKRRVVRYPSNGDLRHLVDVVCIARPLGGELAASSESLAVSWFAPAEIPLNTVPPVVELLRHAFARNDRPVLC